MAFLFNEIIYRPLFNILIWFYSLLFNDLGLAIIFLTVLVRLLLFPLFQKSLKHQKILQEIQPQIKKIQESHKSDKQKQTQAIMEFYKERKINPFMPIFLLLVQLPVLFALYRLFAQGVSESTLNALYPFVAKPVILNHTLLGLIDLGRPNIILTALATITQYFQGQLSLPQKQKGEALSPQERASRQMVYFIPVITLIFLLNLPSAIGLYWIATTIFSIIQQILVNRSFSYERPSGTSRKNN